MIPVKEPSERVSNSFRQFEEAEYDLERGWADWGQQGAGGRPHEGLSGFVVSTRPLAGGGVGIRSGLGSVPSGSEDPVYVPELGGYVFDLGGGDYFLPGTGGLSGGFDRFGGDDLGELDVALKAELPRLRQ